MAFPAQGTVSRVSRLLALVGTLCALAGCQTRRPWREERSVGEHFGVVEWMLGTKDRAVFVGSAVGRRGGGRRVLKPGMVAWLQGQGGEGADEGEPHGLTVDVVKARVYVNTPDGRRLVREYEEGESRDLPPDEVLTERPQQPGVIVRAGLTGKYRLWYDREGDIRLWPSPDGTRLLTQKASRHGPIEVIASDGSVKPLPAATAKGLASTYSRFPFAFIQWEPDSQHIIAVSTHRPEARGYAFLARWRLNMLTGQRKPLGEWLMLLSDEVGDWRLVPVPEGASIQQAQSALRNLTQGEALWVRHAASQALDQLAAWRPSER